MSLPNYLTLKSSGIYRYVFDKTIIPEEQRSSIRLVVGYSEKGPFNTPVYVESESDFIQIFGGISRRMERKGIFFHRLALQALAAGPILALNLKPFSTETSKILSFNASDIKGSFITDSKSVTTKGADGNNTTTTISGRNDDLLSDALVALPEGKVKSNDAVRSIYDTNRFWKVTDDLFNISGITYDTNNKMVITRLTDDNKSKNNYIRIVQTGSKKDSVTIFIRPYVPTGYDVKISDWYSTNNSQEMPPYMESIKDHYLSEFFAEIYVFRGDLAKAELYKSTGSLGSYPAFSKDIKDWVPMAEVKTEGDKNVVYTNPNYKDSFGDNIDALQAMANVQTSNFIGVYRGILFPSFNNANGTCISLDAVFNADNNVHRCVMQFNEQLLDDAYDADINASEAYDTNEAADTNMANIKGLDHSAVKNNYGIASIVHALCSPVHSIIGAGDDSRMYNNYTYPDEVRLRVYKKLASKIIPNDSYSSLDGYVDYKACFDADTHAPVSGYSVDDYKKLASKIIPNKDYQNLTKYKAYADLFEVKDDKYVPKSDTKDDAIKANGDALFKEVTDKKNATLLADFPGTDAAIKKAGDALFKASTDNSTALRDTFIAAFSNMANTCRYLVATPGYYLEGYVYKTIMPNESGADLTKKIQEVMAYKGIYEALTNNVDSDWHYLVDTFQSYPGIAIKSNMSQICQAKFNCLGILNFPPMHDCATFEGYPGLNGGFDMSDVTNRASGISLPSEDQGASFVGYYTQLKMTDGSYTFTVPSAALVSNRYMAKYSTYRPYDIIAGTNKGTINYPGVIGPDYNYARHDMDQLEPFGVNIITTLPRYGIVINSEQTAKQTPVSALSKIHVRELITYIQDEIEYMLRRYWWELNTADLRANIKAKADTILSRIQADGGIYAFTTQCDDQNNTTEMIDNDLLLLDMEVEPARGAGKLVQTLTLRRTGSLQATV